MTSAEAVVIDTGVGVVANGSDDISPECQLACIDVLETVMRGGCLVLDDLDLIFTEYRRRLSMSGQPGPGDAFMLWVSTNRYNPTVCAHVTLTPLDVDEGLFAELEITPDLEAFDRSDRKFAAVARTYPAPLYVSVDRGWSRNRAALERRGVELRFLCPDDIAE